MEMQEVFVVSTLAVFNICWSMMDSLPVRTLILRKSLPPKLLQAPLFPMEASGKGATGSQISPGGTKKKNDPPSFWFPVLGTLYPGLFFTSFLVPILVNR